MFRELVKEMGNKHLISKWFGYESYSIIWHDSATLGLYRASTLVATIDNTNMVAITSGMGIGGYTGRKAATRLMGYMPIPMLMQVRFNLDASRVVLTIGSKRYVVDRTQNVVIDFSCAIPEIKSETIPQFKRHVDRKAKRKVLAQWEDTVAHIRFIAALEKGMPGFVYSHISEERLEYAKMDFSKPPSLENRASFVDKMLVINNYNVVDTLKGLQQQILQTFKDFRTIKVAIPKGEI